MPMMKTAGYFCRDHGLAAFARQVGIHGEQFFGVEEGELFGQIGIARIAQFGEHFLREFLGADEDFPDLTDDGLQKFQIALLGGDDPLPVPLIDVGGMVVIEEVIFADGAHVGADAFAGAAIELLEGDALPLGGGLHDLGVDGMLVAVVRDVELNGRTGAVAVEHVIDAAFDIDDERDLDHHQVEFLA